jgi:transposase
MSRVEAVWDVSTQEISDTIKQKKEKQKMQDKTKKVVQKSSLAPKTETHKFKKGCTPWNKGKKMPKKDSPKTEAKSKKKPIDENTVEIKIVKESKPLPSKEFEGKFEDIKEHTAISFIRAVLANEPDCINIDGRKYYRNNILKNIYDERN